MRRKGAGLMLGLLLVATAWGDNGYQNVVNRRWDTVADGPMGGVVVDVQDVAAPVERATRLRGTATRGVGRYQGPAWFQLLKQRRLLPATQPPPVLPQTVALRQGNRLVLPELDRHRARQASTLGQSSNQLTVDFSLPVGESTAKAWSGSQQQLIQTYVTALLPVLTRIYGPPAFNLTVNLLHDKTLASTTMAAYDATSNQIRIELLSDVDSSDPTLTPVDSYDLYTLTLALVKAYHDDVFIGYDSWEDGMARAVQLLAMTQVRPDFGFLARDFNLLYSHYDVLNQPGLESPSFLGGDAGTTAATMREALGTVRAYLSQAAWLKIYAENPAVFSQFNAAYYARVGGDPTLAQNIPLLKAIVHTATPKVEGLDYNDWYRRQYVFDTALVPGAKMYVFNVPQKDFITGEATNSLPMNVYLFNVSNQNVEQPLTGTVKFAYTAYDGFDLTPAVEGAAGTAGIQAGIGQNGNPAGIGSAVPLFFNIAGDQQVQQQRITVRATVNGIERDIAFPNDVVADDNQVQNHLYGLVTNGFQGSLKISIQGKDDITAKVIQGAFGVRVPGGLPVPASATFAFTPDSSGGSQADTIQRDVMFVGPIGTGVDAREGGMVVVLETPPETFTTFTQTINAGISMVTIPAFCLRKDAPELFGLSADQILMARADGAVPGFQSWRQGSVYRIYPDTPAIRPGYAYWVQTKTPLTLNFQGVPASKDRPFRQTFPPGWQQFGNPYQDLNLLLQNLRVQATDGSADVSYGDATTAGLISSGVFTYNQTTGGYDVVPATAILNPYQGYWINVLDAHGATLVFPNSLSVGSRSPRSAPTRARAVDPNRWHLGLVTRCGSYQDGTTRLAVAPAAGDGYSVQDIARPPSFGPFVQTSVIQTGWGRAAGRYAVDVREANGADKAWDLTVESNLGQREVTVSWPDLGTVPPNVTLLLTDQETGRQRSMRSTSSYTFQLGASGQRALRVTASRNGQAGLVVANLDLRTGRGGGGTVAFSLSGPATVTVTLNSQSGRLVRTVSSGRAATRGANELSFQAVDDQGRPLPRGVYRLDLVALDETGRQVRTSRVVRVER